MIGRMIGRMIDSAVSAGLGGRTAGSVVPANKGRGERIVMFANGTPAPDLGDVAWRKSVRSNSQGNCAQFAQLPCGQVGLRDSKDPAGPALVFDADEAAGFIRELKGGVFDHLLAEV